VLDCSPVMRAGRGAPRVEVELTNRSDAVALAAQIILRDARTRERVLPAYASDNFVSLLPGEARRIIIEVPASEGARPMLVELKGWNVRAGFVPVER
jgi:mannosylglycoprotein endo-beta-mannosidase